MSSMDGNLEERELSYVYTQSLRLEHLICTLRVILGLGIVHIRSFSYNSSWSFGTLSF